MTIPRGKEIYNLDNLHVISRGVSYSDNELYQCINGPVSEILFDKEGIDTIENLLSGIPETDFEGENLKRILSAKHEPENWRVGEVLAESYLCAHNHCSFPWNSDRDKKNESASLQGADLVGFQKTSEINIRFAFGEVKTSEEKKYPPSVIHSLKSQLEDLYAHKNKRDILVKYLGHRPQNPSSEQHYKAASKKYLKNDRDVSLFGFLVRDVAPDEKDLNSITHRFSEICSPLPSLELTALYLPAGSIHRFSSQVMATFKEGDE